MPARPKRSIRQVDLGAANTDHEHTESDITDLDHYTDTDANAAIDARVNKAFVDALNVDADTVDGKHASAFADATHTHVEADIADLDHYDSSDFATDHANADHSHDHDAEYSQLGHQHTESDITDLDHWDQADTEGVIDAYVDKTFVDALNVDADTLDGEHASAFADAVHSHELDELDATAATNGHVLTAQGDGTAAWEAPVTGVTDHGALTGLGDDDHSQYLNTARHAVIHTSARYDISVDQTVPTATLVTVKLDTVTFENNSGGDLSFNSSTGELTINTTGIYQLIGAIQWDNSNTGERQVRIAVNGSPIGLVRQLAVETSNGNVSLLAELTANDVVTLVGRQTSGGNLDITGSAGDTTFLAIIRVA